jgi:diguanylate cyclase (GGDEF)-like protein/PAS domain S-box-containing protein
VQASIHRKTLLISASAGSAIASVIFLLWLIFSWGGERVTVAVDDFGLILAPMLAVAGCGRAAARSRGRTRTVWTLLAASALSWGLGEVAWTYYELFLQQAPFPSIADIGFLAAVPLAGAALVIYSSTGQAGSATLVKRALDGLIVSFSLLMVSWTLVLHATVDAGADTPLIRVLTLAYPSSDVAMLALVVLALARGRTKTRSAMLLVGLGLASISFADSAFAYFGLIGDYTTGAFADLGWFTGYLLVMLGGLRARPDDGVKEVELPSRASVLLPYVPVGLAGGAAIFELTRAEPDPLFWSVGFALFAVVVIRQLATLLEHVGLVRDLESRVEERTGELRQATVALEHRERHFRSLVQNATDLIVVTESDGTVTYASPSSSLLLGRRPDELVGRSLAWLLHPDDRERLGLLGVAVAARPDATHSVEWRLAHARGGWRVIDTTVASQFAGDGTVNLVLNGRDVTDRKALEEQLRHAAFHDDLTGLPNRALFQDRLDHALAIRAREGGIVAVLFLDLDDFKVVNDTAGHEIGDALLGQVATRFSAVIRPGDTVSRLGGDEFAVVLTGLPDTEAAGHVAAKLQAQLNEPIIIEADSVEVHASIGIAVTGDTECTSEELIRHADIAMYVAKSDGKGRHRFYEPAMHAGLVERMELQAALTVAIDHNEFSMHYQPIVDLETSHMVGMEALIRWTHPRFGSVPPAAFIPIAERSGLIVPIGAWVLETVCHQMDMWSQDGLCDDDLEVSVNLSARQLVEPTLTDDIQEVLARHHIAPGRLVLEITETILMEDIDRVLRTLDELRAIGIRLAIDDFGTGYSSLSYLARLPVQILKIDRSFIVGAHHEPAAQALLASILHLANELNLQTVAEGIEEEETGHELRALGCNLGQGYWYGRPGPAETMTALLAARTQRLPAIR